MDIAVDIPLTSWLGSVKLGRQKVGLSQEWIMPGADWIFMERSGMANAIIPQRNIGLRLHRSFADGRATGSGHGRCRDGTRTSISQMAPSTGESCRG
jgi:hypothetical protein